MSDPSGTLATPVDVVADPGSEDGIAEIACIAAEREIESVVVGLPISLSGSEGEQAREVLAFVDRLRGALSVPVETYDERFTTKLAEADQGRAPEDSRAAAHLLTSYLRSLDQTSR